MAAPMTALVVGQRVWTPKGTGTIAYVNEEDIEYMVKLDGGGGVWACPADLVILS